MNRLFCKRHFLPTALALLGTTLPALAAQQQSPRVAPPATQPSSQPATQAAVTLNIGDPAPPLGSGRWLKGEPVVSFEPGKVYVVEFWATWCGPCIAAIPKITELQQKYADQGVIVIGQNVAEQDASRVEPFLAEQGDRIGYRIVMDQPPGLQGYMAQKWLAAAGQDSIPCTMVIDQQGRLAWVGHPLGVAAVVEKVLAGTHDLAAAKRERELEFQTAVLNRQMNDALRAGDLERALERVEQITALRPDLAPQAPLVKFNLLGHSGRWDEAYAFIDGEIETMSDPLVLNSLAWLIVDPASLLPKKNFDVALKAALKANELTEGKNGAIVDTLARCWFLMGDKEKALELQKKAVELTPEGELKQRLIKRMQEYEQVQ